MSERTNGFYKLVTIPALYREFQNILGGVSAREAIRAQFFPDVAGKNVLEVGCGPGNWYEHLQDVGSYLGIDWNAAHIETANNRFQKPRTEFLVGDVSDALKKVSSRFDYVFAFGLLHHLDDEQCRSMFTSIRSGLHENGRFVTVDPVYHDNQNRFARWMNDRDSGQNIRTPDAYKTLLTGFFDSVKPTVCTDKLRIPYSHFISVCGGKSATET